MVNAGYMSSAPPTSAHLPLEAPYAHRSGHSKSHTLTGWANVCACVRGRDSVIIRLIRENTAFWPN